MDGGFHAKSRRFAENSNGLDDEMLLQKGGK